MKVTSRPCRRSQICLVQSARVFATSSRQAVGKRNRGTSSVLKRPPLGLNGGKYFKMSADFQPRGATTENDSTPVLVAMTEGGDPVVLSAPVTTGGTAVQIGNASGLLFNITYDTSVNSAPAGFTAAIAYVASYYSSVFNDPVTVNLNLGWGEVAGQPLGAGALGQSETYLVGLSYSQLRSAFQADAKTADDNAAVTSLPASNPTGGNLFISTSEAKALGLTVNTSIDGYVGFSSFANFTFDPNDRAVPGAVDFIGVA